MSGRVGLWLLGLLGAGCAGGSADQGAAEAGAQVVHVDPQGAQALLRGDTPPVVLDIRTAGEVASGIVDGAVHLDFHGKDFASSLAGLPTDRAILVTCASGGRSTRALPVLQAAGLTDLVHLDGGMNAWRAAGLPVVKP